MKKRQKPILLVTLLVIALGGVAFVGGLANGPSQPQAPDPSQDQPLAKPQAPTTSPKSVGSDVAAKLSGASGAGGAGAGAGPQGGPRPLSKSGPPEEPLVKTYKLKPFKPTPNEQSVSSQWYSSESMNGNK